MVPEGEMGWGKGEMGEPSRQMWPPEMGSGFSARYQNSCNGISERAEIGDVR